MSMFLAFLAIAAQATGPATTPSHLRGRGTSMRNEGTRESRLELQRFGACLAHNSPAVATEALRSNPTARNYHLRLNRLISANEGCFGRRGYRMAFAKELITASLAEAMLAGGGAPLNVRLARAAMRAPVAPFSPADRAAICVVRSVPDETATLLRTEVGTAEEEAAAAAVTPGLGACLQSIGLRAQVTTAGLRGMLASAAFRSIDAASASTATLSRRD